VRALVHPTPTCLGLLGWADTSAYSGDALKESPQVGGPEGC